MLYNRNITLVYGLVFFVMLCFVLCSFSFIWEGGPRKFFNNQIWALSYKRLSTPGISLPLVDYFSWNSPPLVLSAFSKSLLLHETTTVSKLATYALKMAKFDKDLDHAI